MKTIYIYPQFPLYSTKKNGKYFLKNYFSLNYKIYEIFVKKYYEIFVTVIFKKLQHFY